MKKLLTILTVLLLASLALNAIGNDQYTKLDGRDIGNSQVLQAMSRVSEGVDSIKTEITGMKSDVVEMKSDIKVLGNSVDFLKWAFGFLVALMIAILGVLLTFSSRLGKLEGEVEMKQIDERRYGEKEQVIKTILERLNQIEQRLPHGAVAGLLFVLFLSAFLQLSVPAFAIGNDQYTKLLLSFDGGVVKTIAAEPASAITSPLRVLKNGTVYGVVVVDPTDAKATGVRVKTAGGVKAVRKL